ncbi:helix-turn-helix domain-containing protein [Rhizobium leguminosarum]|uniref:helix-turn-helix domain-containing protein n=1 Tax=Rhizobium leguminosarum TaxID=384 RepID=UPI001FF02C13|nr:helix-turn-helix transcriptional regulator [Rhizobium leguminosarum]
MPITGYQIRAARSLVGIEQVALAEKAGVSANTIRNMEAFGAERVKVRTDTLDAVTDALKQAGVIFVDEGPSEGGPGVRISMLAKAYADGKEAHAKDPLKGQRTNPYVGQQSLSDEFYRGFQDAAKSV